MIDIKDLFVIILYASLIVLVIVAIIFLIKMMHTLKKVDKVVEEVDQKVNKLNGLFDIIDVTTDAITSFSDRIVNSINNGITWLLHRKKKGEEDE